MPKAKTIEKHKKDGTYRPERHGNKVETKPMQTVPKPPSTLPEGAKAYWKAICQELISRSLLQSKDLMAIEVLASTHYFAVTCAQIVDKEGVVLVMPGREGDVTRKHPALAGFLDAQVKLLTLYGRFGLTVIDGQKIAAVDQETDNPDDDLFD